MESGECRIFIFIFNSLFSIFNCSALRLCAFALIFFLPIAAQRVAVIVPEKIQQTERYAADMREKLSKRLKVLDIEMTDAAFRSQALQHPFNLTAAESKQLASVIGCDRILILRTGTQRRSSFDKGDYFEAFAVLYLVNGQTGRLDHWDLESFEGTTPVTAERLLFDAVEKTASEVAQKITAALPPQDSQKGFEEFANEDSSAKDFRPPMPYKRIKPEYTRIAYLYDVRATVDASVDVDETGKIVNINIERWAGFGLDESVATAIRRMNWRPATRNDKPLPMRVLLRYNFTKVEKD